MAVQAFEPSSHFESWGCGGSELTFVCGTTTPRSYLVAVRAATVILSVRAPVRRVLRATSSCSFYGKRHFGLAPRHARCKFVQNRGGVIQ